MTQDIGKINCCRGMSLTCSYFCCNSSRFISYKSKPTLENSHILLYPGEYETISSNTRKDHITILGKYKKGLLAYCDNTKLEKAYCDPQINFKPLDCQSYPFFPTIRGGRLGLMIDTRCPLSLIKNKLFTNYKGALIKWERLLPNNDIETWIKSINLKGYELIKY